MSKLRSDLDQEIGEHGFEVRYHEAKYQLWIKKSYIKEDYLIDTYPTIMQAFNRAREIISASKQVAQERKERMMSDQGKMRQLTEEGVKELGNIFPAGVPCKSQTPVTVDVEGEGEMEVYLVDWEDLDHLQKDMIVMYVAHRKIGSREEVIRQKFEDDGCFPLQAKYLIESHDVRFFV